MGARGITRIAIDDKPLIETRTIPITAISHNPNNRRRSYDTPQVDELARSIQEVGLLQPLGVVRYEIYLNRYPEHEAAIGNADWVAIFGNQRLAALRKAGITEAPARVLDDLARDNRIADAVAIENLVRSQLPPLDEAAELKELVNYHGNQSEVAKRLGVTQAFISQRLRLLNLIPELQKLLNAGTIGIRQARKLAELDPQSQLKTWQKISAKPPSEIKTNYNPVIIAGQDVGKERKPAKKAIRIAEPEQMADQIRQYMSPEDIALLGKLLLDDFVS